MEVKLKPYGTSSSLFKSSERLGFSFRGRQLPAQRRWCKVTGLWPQSSKPGRKSGTISAQMRSVLLYLYWSPAAWLKFSLLLMCLCTNACVWSCTCPAVIVNQNNVQYTHMTLYRQNWAGHKGCMCYIWCGLHVVCLDFITLAWLWRIKESKTVFSFNTDVQPSR